MNYHSDDEGSKSVFRYIWRKTVGGHEWGEDPYILEDQRVENGTFLFPKLSLAEPYEYDPLATVQLDNEEPPLFTRFAQLNEWDGSDLADRIIEFADDYGMLGVGRWCHIGETEAMFQIGEIGTPTRVDKGENILVWQEEIKDMALLVQTWTLLKNNKFDELGRHILWADDGNWVRWVYDPYVLDQILAGDIGKQYSYLISDRSGFPEVFDVWEKHGKARIKTLNDRLGWVKGPAEFYLRQRLNLKLKGIASPTFLLSEDTGKSYQRILPEHLLGALWLQFFQAIVGETWIVQCKHCHKWMDVSSRRKRKEVTRCRRCGRREDTRRSRARIQQAHDLYNKGVNIEEIARKVGSNPKTVKGWIDKGPSTTI